jgi:hypothetical protein
MDAMHCLHRTRLGIQGHAAPRMELRVQHDFAARPPSQTFVMRPGQQPGGTLACCMRAPNAWWVYVSPWRRLDGAWELTLPMPRACRRIALIWGVQVAVGR